jgi:hypothetical protein
VEVVVEDVVEVVEVVEKQKKVEIWARWDLDRQGEASVVGVLKKNTHIVVTNNI